MEDITPNQTGQSLEKTLDERLFLKFDDFVKSNRERILNSEKAISNDLQTFEDHANYFTTKFKYLLNGHLANEAKDYLLSLSDKDFIISLGDIIKNEKLINGLVGVEDIKNLHIFNTPFDYLEEDEKGSAVELKLQATGGVPLEHKDLFTSFDTRKQCNILDIYLNKFYIKDPKNKAKDFDKAFIYHDAQGYDRDDLVEREKNNPIPIIQELKMGCFIEQIEPQAREALKVLIGKGYTTVQSGFHSLDNWSQFFDIDNPIFQKIDQNTINQISSDFEQKYKVKVLANQLSLDDTEWYLEVEPIDKYNVINIDEWKVILDDLADKMPVFEEVVGFSQKGETHGFVAEVIRDIPKEKMLEQCKNKAEIDLIESLYAAKNRAEIDEIIGYKDE